MKPVLPFLAITIFLILHNAWAGTSTSSNKINSKAKLVRFHPISQAEYNAILKLTNGKQTITEGRLINSSLTALRELVAGLTTGLSTNFFPAFLTSIGIGALFDRADHTAPDKYNDGYPLCVVAENEQQPQQPQQPQLPMQHYQWQRQFMPVPQRPLVNCILVVKRPDDLQMPVEHYTTTTTTTTTTTPRPETEYQQHQAEWQTHGYPQAQPYSQIPPWLNYAYPHFPNYPVYPNYAGYPNFAHNPQSPEYTQNTPPPTYHTAHEVVPEEPQELVDQPQAYEPQHAPDEGDEHQHSAHINESRSKQQRQEEEEALKLEQLQKEEEEEALRLEQQQKEEEEEALRLEQLQKEEEEAAEREREAAQKRAQRKRERAEKRRAQQQREQLEQEKRAQHEQQQREQYEQQRAQYEQQLQQQQQQQQYQYLTAPYQYQQQQHFTEQHAAHKRHRQENEPYEATTHNNYQPTTYPQQNYEAVYPKISHNQALSYPAPVYTHPAYPHNEVTPNEPNMNFYPYYTTLPAYAEMDSNHKALNAPTVPPARHDIDLDSGETDNPDDFISVSRRL